jgi:hypothetical protein
MPPTPTHRDPWFRVSRLRSSGDSALGGVMIAIATRCGHQPRSPMNEARRRGVALMGVRDGGSSSQRRIVKLERRRHETRDYGVVDHAHDRSGS